MDDGNDILELAEKAWKGELAGEVSVESFLTNTIVALPGLQGVHFACTFANVTVIDLPTGGIALVDCGAALTAHVVQRLVRQIRPDARVEAIIYTHGHADHVMGSFVFDEEARERGWRLPTVYAHRNLAARFDRYKFTCGYNETINRRQFRVDIDWPSEYRYPDVVYDEELTLLYERPNQGESNNGGQRNATAARTASGVPSRLHLQLVHGKGETDDATWLFCPEYRLLCTGDMFVWVTPNCGNPQKVQRYPREWAHNLRRMVALRPALLLPGHGPPILGAERVAQALSETAEFLEDLVKQTVDLLNLGETLDEIVQRVRPNARLLERPYMAPVYDEPEFIVRNLWRLYGGWWSGAPDELKPAPKRALASEVTALIPDGTATLVKRARDLSANGEHALACHLVEYAYQATTGKNVDVLRARRDIYKSRAKTERSLMSGSIFRDAYLRSNDQIERLCSHGSDTPPTSKL